MLVMIAVAARAEPAHANGGPLVKLAEIGPWSSVSVLIGFGDRLWFANSVKYVNHNSSDLYSYDPGTGALRYERHLFSQDVGDPAVLNGRLYWPFEDARGSAGVGEFLATDGEHWDWRVISGARAFHAHFLLAHDGALYAGLSAWRAVIMRSDDGGLSWRGLYRHPTEDGGVSRVTALAVLGESLFAGLTAETQLGPKLLVEGAHGLRPLPGWPERGATTALAAFNGQVYGVVWQSAVARTWRTDGARIEPVSGLGGVGVRGFAATDRTLYAISANKGTGALWKSRDGDTWTVVQTFADAEPEALAVYAGKVYVGTTGPGPHGALWGPPAPAPTETAIAPVGRLPSGADPFADSAGVTRAFAALDAALPNPQAYGHGFAGLVYQLSRSPRPEVGAGLAARLAGPFPQSESEMFGGALKLTPRDIGRWYLLRAMALSGHDRVPPDLIAEPFRSPQNKAEKYFDIAPLAAWVAGELGQDDDATLSALIARLGNPNDPPWLDGDLIGALTALTGQRFGYDRTAWRDWWAARAVQPSHAAISRSASSKSSGLLTLKNGSSGSAANSTVATR